MEKTIYDLKLHESIEIHYGVDAMRVPGGWIYNRWDIEQDEFKAGIFVPYNNEFQVV